MSINPDRPSIIFILGIMPRSGTHFLANLLCHHPDCDKSVFPEDGLIANADDLFSYARRLKDDWDATGEIKFQPGVKPRDLLLESLGDGLIDFLGRARANYLGKKGVQMSHVPRRLVTKSPQVVNLDKFFKLFPNEPLVIIIRDGRAVIESAAVSFDYDREESIRHWAAAAKKIARFEDDKKNDPDQYLIVKYERLCTETTVEMRKILDFLKLDRAKYDFQTALDLPVVGSSSFKRGDRDVHWLPVIKTDDFAPLARAKDWGRGQHERFNWLAKNELLRFGYQPVEFSGGKIYWQVWNQFYDLVWHFKIWLARTGRFPAFFTKRLKGYFGK